MSISFEGIGQWCATFACENVREGMVVKMKGNGKVGKSGEGDFIFGVVTAVAHDGKACSVQLGGFVTLPYTGVDDPTLGLSNLTADGNGGVMHGYGTGQDFVAVCVDKVAKTVTIKL